jgi:hypothetical protein
MGLRPTKTAAVRQSILKNAAGSLPRQAGRG